MQVCKWTNILTMKKDRYMTPSGILKESIKVGSKKTMFKTESIQ